VHDIAICTDAFGDPRTHAYGERFLACMLWGLVFANEATMTVRRYPALYNSGVKWEAEKPLGVSACRGGNGQERFLGVRQVLQDGKADCEDLVCWRVAELRLGVGVMQFGLPPRAGHPPVTVVPLPFPMQVAAGGVDVLPAFFSRKTGPRSWLYHIVVAWPSPNGGFLFEDPSRVCGMGGRG
jgi:hypothetical protein